MKQSDFWKPWIPIVTNRLAHEAEVCKKVKECEVTDIIVANKGPLMVSSALLSVCTKLIHSLMDPICEKKDYYGDVQYGVRSNCSTSIVSLCC